MKLIDFSRNRKLMLRINLLIAVLVIGYSVSSEWLELTDKQQQKLGNIDQQAAQLLEYERQRLDQILSRIEGIVTLAAETVRHKPPSEMLQALRATVINDSLRSFGGRFYAIARGSQLAHAGSPEPDIDIFVKAGIESNKPWLSARSLGLRLYAGASEAKLQLLVAYPVEGGVGLFVFDLPAISRSELSGQAKLLLIDQHNIGFQFDPLKPQLLFLSHDSEVLSTEVSERSRERYGATPTGQISLSSRLEGELSVHRAEGNLTGDYYLVSVQLPNLNWQLYGAVPVGDYLTEARGEIYEILTQLVILSLMFIVSDRFIRDYHRVVNVANVDQLTGLYNRVHLDDFCTRLDELWNRGRIENLSVIMIDIDHFKRINDTYGHNVGDEVLQQMAKTVRSSCRGSDTVYRLGGEEFLVVCFEPLPSAMELAERIRQQVSADPGMEVILNGGITVSLGVAEWKTGEHRKELLERADANLYQAKKNGRDQVAA